MLDRDKKLIKSEIYQYNRLKSNHEEIYVSPVLGGAGGKKGRDCTLILCEGLSAKTYAVSGDDFAETVPLTKTQLLNIAKGQPLRIRITPTEMLINA